MFIKPSQFIEFSDPDHRTTHFERLHSSPVVMAGAITLIVWDPVFVIKVSAPFENTQTIRKIKAILPWVEFHSTMCGSVATTVEWNLINREEVEELGELLKGPIH